MKIRVLVWLSMALWLVVGAPVAFAAESVAAPTLKDKFTGCIAGSWIGSAMGAPVETWPAERVKQEYGYVDKFLTYRHYQQFTNWQRPPGTTEDGIERQKLISTAIIEKQGRIQAQDLVRVWLRDLDPAKTIYKQEGFDITLKELAAAGVPPSDLGRLWQFPNVISMARVSHPLGLINAGDPQTAADDSIEVGKVYAGENYFALRWAAVYNAAIAEACKPGATVDSVIATVQEFIKYRGGAGPLYDRYDTMQRDIDQALELAAKSADAEAMRAEFDKTYFSGRYFNYPMSQANEIVSKGLAIFVFTKGDPKQAILTSVNFGRDTDCLAAIAGGLAGALSGTKGLPQEWIDQVNEATRLDQYTNNKRTIEETADGLYEAYKARMKELNQYMSTMGDPAYMVP